MRTERRRYIAYKRCQSDALPRFNMFPINQPEVMIGNTAERFDPQGNLTDEATKDHIRRLLQSLVQWTCG